MTEVAPTVRIATVTVSDTRTPATDTAGLALRQELAGFVLAAHRIIPDSPSEIKKIVFEAHDSHAIDAVVFTGGTGIGPRDQTFEAVRDVLDKELPGFGEAFRRLSWDAIGPRAILSQAAAGVHRTLLVFVLPGSEHAARLGARELIAPVVAHASAVVRGGGHHR